MAEKNTPTPKKETPKKEKTVKVKLLKHAYGMFRVSGQPGANIVVRESVAEKMKAAKFAE
jgi:hypothetical protein